MQHIERLIIFLFFLSLISCHESEEKETDTEYCIKWDQNTIVCVSDEGAYPRMRRLNDNTLLVVYEDRKGNVATKRSADNGASWSSPSIVYSGFDYVNEISGLTCKINIGYS